MSLNPRIQELERKEEMRESTHSNLQASINRLQLNNDELSSLLSTLCQKLGYLVDYKHKEKKHYKVFVNIDGKYYDVYDLIKQTEEYISAGKEDSASNARDAYGGYREDE